MTPARVAQGPYIGGFSTVMSVPKTPTSLDKSQVLFYFPGAENTDGTPRHGAPPPSGRAILQPVLTYAPEENCVGSTPKSKTGWCISSWCVCRQTSMRRPRTGHTPAHAPATRVARTARPHVRAHRSPRVCATLSVRQACHSAACTSHSPSTPRGQTLRATR